MKKLSVVSGQWSVVFVSHVEPFNVSGKLRETDEGQLTTNNGHPSEGGGLWR